MKSIIQWLSRYDLAAPMPDDLAPSEHLEDLVVDSGLKAFYDFL